MSMWNVDETEFPMEHVFQHRSTDILHYNLSISDLLVTDTLSNIQHTWQKWLQQWAQRVGYESAWVDTDWKYEYV